MKLVRAFVLVLTICVCAHAGEIPNNLTADGAMGNMDNGVTATPPSSPSAQGEMQGRWAEAVTEIALSLLQRVFALF